ncbi:NEDD4-binding protein 2-like isoform 1 [Cricetulus griseus]|uniref:NEDD4-binding protein 2-like isoform 1 n=1 Tax=Cricetulus griseus TaxID=10029 RepID=A0A061I9L5_CRIGR|nr:NEDD4-binding protein 2-like isoform 1 [Cricetulus griseus]
MPELGYPSDQDDGYPNFCHRALFQELIKPDTEIHNREPDRAPAIRSNSGRKGYLSKEDHNYSLEHTVQFLNCVLEGEAVKTVVASECVHQNENISSHTAPKPKDKKAKKPSEKDDISGDLSFQDFECPEYDDHRAEAFLHQQKRMECYSKAKEAYCMRKKNVATFYAQQDSLHEQKMKETNHLAAVEIFEKVNASLLP